MSKRRAWLMLIGVLAVIGCVGGDPVGSSSEDLTGIDFVAYNNMPMGIDHFGTSSTITVVDSSCGGVGNTYRTTTAWEEESIGTSDNPTSLWLGNACGFNPMTINFGGSALPLNTALTGTPAEWNTLFPGQPMFWLKEPTLVPVRAPATSQVIALVGLVGLSPTGPANEIAVALSLDGGQTWNNPSAPARLLLQTPGNGIDDLAVSAGGGDYDLAGGNYLTKYNTNTYDIYVTWWDSFPHRWFDVAAFKYNAWSTFDKGVPVDLNAAAPGVFNPTGQPANDIVFMSIVSGTAVLSSGKQPLVFVQWPLAYSLHTPPTQSCPQTETTGYSGVAWHTAISYNYGVTWQRLADSHPQVGVLPECAGDQDLTPGDAQYRNALRSSLAFEPHSFAVVDAVAMWDRFDSVPGTYVEANGWDFSTPALPSPVAVFHSTHTDTQPRQDQFLPVVAANLGLGGAQEYVTIGWVDSVDDPLGANVPSGLYGVTSKAFKISAPAFSAVSRAWPVPPAAPAAFAAGYDSLGRHNSMSVEGFSWLTFSGDDMTLPHESIDTVGISPL